MDVVAAPPGDDRRPRTAVTERGEGVDEKSDGHPLHFSLQYSTVEAILDCDCAIVCIVFAHREFHRTL